jgi:hypothetical protein
MRFLAAAILSIVISAPCFGFEPGIHKSISLKAADVYSEYLRKKTGGKMEGKYIEAFVKGSVAEDDFTWDRLTNWHFYNKEDRKSVV